jgi:excisionase family DNA binding protein
MNAKHTKHPSSAKATLLSDRLSLNISEAAEVLGVSKPTLHRMLKQEVVKHRRYGRRVFISVASLKAFLESK